MILSRHFHFPAIAIALLTAIACKKIEPTPTSTERAAINSKAIEAYLEANSIVGWSKTSEGVYYKIDSSTADSTLKAGMIAFIDYTGYLLADNSVIFDSTTGPTDFPFRYVIGTSSVIDGWRYGLPKFRVGERGRLFIPSQLAYGSAAKGVITANSNLIFDIKVVSAR